MRKKASSVFIIIVGIVLVLFILKRGPRDLIQKRTRFLMDTYCTIQVPGNKQVLNAIDKAFDRMEEIDQKFNALNPNSVLYRFNNSNIDISDKEIVSLIKTSQKVSEDSDGAFDITVFPLMKLWGFHSDTDASLPEKEAISKYLEKVGYKNLNITNGTLTKLDKNVEIDLGGIAKGYAIKEAVEVLRGEGIQSALIDAGGDIFAFGRLKKRLWKVGIRNPREEGLIGVLEVSDRAVVTSGDYERSFEQNGIRYHHILDPKTGYPARGLVSVTVISSDPVLADAWATAFFVMGKEKSLELAEKMPDTEIVMITSEDKILYSSGLQKNLIIDKKN